MSKAFIRSIDVPGFPGVYRAGRLWPGGQTVEVDVVRGDVDPPQVEGEPLKICDKSLAAIRADGRLSVLEKAEAAPDIQALLDRVESLSAELTGARKDAEALAAENDALRAQVESLSAEKKKK